MERRTLILLAVGAVAAGASCASGPDRAREGGVDAELARFLEAQVRELKVLDKESGLAWFEASVTGTDEAFARSRRADEALLRFLSDPERFAKVRAFREEEISDPTLRRQLEVLYLEMLGKQVDPKLLERINALEKEVEQAFNTYRGKVGGEEVTQNRIEEILRTSTDSQVLREAWEAQKAVAPLVVPKLLELVELRNRVARELGFRDYYQLRLAESEIDEKQLLDLFDRLDELTREPFLKMKRLVDERLAKRYGLTPDRLMPWHYQNPFFQEPPDVFAVGLDEVYREHDTLEVCRRFYNSIGIEVDGIISRSDLYEKKGKSPHAFAIDIDREGDVRVLANIVPGIKWQSTMVHELGHAVYDEHIDRELPWLLRSAAHPMTTEGLAMMLDRLVGNPYWAWKLGLIDEKRRDAMMPEAKLKLAFAPLVFSRWTQVMLRFERELYRDPKQNLNKLWWDLVERYQGVRRPPDRDAPDYASKIHLVIVPVYYHNYMLGELFGAQVHEKLAEIEKTDPLHAVYVGNRDVGRFLIEKIFAFGKLYRWDELTRRVTGRDLGPEAFARRFAEL